VSKENHEISAAVATCMDFRFQKLIADWIEERSLYGDHDRIAVAGAAGDRDALLSQIKLSIKLHGTKGVHIINHQNCGKYGNSLVSGSRAELEKHTSDISEIKEIITHEYPEVTVLGYFATLDEDGKANSINPVEI